eukprot:m.56689 g.56689  ORF g.56689 m.56689 type:complete len:209 (+) comp7697_c0_seq2:267-893(+)
MLTAPYVHAVIGFVGWSLFEYSVHRYAFHASPKAGVSKTRIARSHHTHHLDPDTFPTATKRRILVSVTWVLLTLLFWPLVGRWPAAGLAGGFALGYATYTYTHQALHQCAPVGTLAGVPVPGLAAWGAYIRRHHFYHHFENAGTNHAVIFPPWDILFGTAASIHDRGHHARIRVPVKTYPILWLVDEQTGSVKPEFSGTYTDESEIST